MNAKRKRTASQKKAKRNPNLKYHWIYPRGKVSTKKWRRQNWKKDAILLDSRIRKAWRFLFDDLHPKEISKFIRRVMQPGLIWSHSDIARLRDEIAKRTTHKKRHRVNLNKHHMKPSSRFHEDSTPTERNENNVVKLDREFHNAWHALFYDMTVDEALDMIVVLSIPGLLWEIRDIAHLREALKKE